MKAWEYILKNKVAVGVISLILLILVIWLIIKFSRKNKGSIKRPANFAIPTDNAILLDPSNPLYEQALAEFNQKAKATAASLYAKLKGLNVGTDYSALENYADRTKTPNDLFAEAYWVFGEEYGEGESLRQWLTDEWYAPWSTGATARTKIFERMNELGLS